MVILTVWEWPFCHQRYRHQRLTVTLTTGMLMLTLWNQVQVCLNQGKNVFAFILFVACNIFTGCPGNKNHWWGKILLNCSIVLVAKIIYFYDAIFQLLSRDLNKLANEAHVVVVYCSWDSHKYQSFKQFFFGIRKTWTQVFKSIGYSVFNLILWN